MKNSAFLHFGGAFVGMPNGPFATTETDLIEVPDVTHELGMHLEKGRRIPTRYKVRKGARFCRVYLNNKGPVETFYIEEKGKKVATVQF